MKTLNRSTIISLLMSLALVGSLTHKAHALQTQEVEIGAEAGYDGAVAIARDASGRMTFRDAELTTGVTLRELYELSSGPNFIDIDEIVAGRLEIGELEIDGHTLRNPNTDGDIHLQTLGGGLLRIFAATQIAANLEIAGAVDLGDAPTDVITVPGSIEGSLKPNTPASSQLGTLLQPWGILYLDNLKLDSSALSATTDDGVWILDNGGNLGLRIKDGGKMGNIANPNASLHLGDGSDALLFNVGNNTQLTAIAGETQNAGGLTIDNGLLRMDSPAGMIVDFNTRGLTDVRNLSVENDGSAIFTITGGNTVGNVGIGVAAPAHPLEFASGAKVTSAGVFVDASSRDFKIGIEDEPTTGVAGNGRVGLWDLIDEIPVRRFQYREMIDRVVVRQTPDGPTTETIRARGAAGDGDVRSGFIYEDLPPQLRHGDRGVSATELAAVAIAAARENKRRVLRLERALERSERRLRALETRLRAGDSRATGLSTVPAVPLFDEADHR